MEITQFMGDKDIWEALPPNAPPWLRALSTMTTTWTTAI